MRKTARFAVVAASPDKVMTTVASVGLINVVTLGNATELAVFSLRETLPF